MPHSSPSKPPSKPLNNGARPRNDLADFLRLLHHGPPPLGLRLRRRHRHPPRLPRLDRPQLDPHHQAPQIAFLEVISFLSQSQTGLRFSLNRITSKKNQRSYRGSSFVVREGIT